ncbi:MAG TPA: efflux RND transporter periplasmic adaptor subunit [Methylophaga sp.]|nr:efflux RND transporter periplasmic adaptor subunit [Methylophaga sp.]
MTIQFCRFGFISAVFGIMLTVAPPLLAEAPDSRPLVKVMTPEQREVIEWQEFTGRFEAVEEVAIRARVTGYLDAVHFKDGQMVNKGDLLFEIDPRPFQAALARAEANLAKVQSQLKLTELEVNRGERLLTQQAIAVEEVDSRRARFQEANANVAAARAALQTASLDLQYSKISAPVSGRISSRNIDIGNLVTTDSSAMPLTTIVKTDPLHFVFDVSEAEYLQFARVAGGEAALTGESKVTAQIRLADENNWDRQGVLDFVDNRLNENTGTLRMRVLVDNPSGLLRPGIFGRLRMAISDPYQALLIPDRALVSDQAAKVVMVVTPDGVVKATPVQPGTLLADEMRVIREGINKDDHIIIEGLLKARPGSSVRTENYQAVTGE